jgi:hypothetical protein
MTINELIATSSVHAFNSGLESGKGSERKRLVDTLLIYLELTKEPNDEGLVTDNPEWEAGFQAAVAIIKGQD